MYITVLDDGDDECSVRISHLNGPPETITFTEGLLKMRSFVSLLAGYYRLSVRWGFDLCRSMPGSPWMDRLRRVAAHGPIDEAFTRSKLAKYSDDQNQHPFIFRLSPTDFTLFYITLQDRSYSVRVDLRQAKPRYVLINNPESSCLGGGYRNSSSNGKKSFPTHNALFDYIRSSVVVDKDFNFGTVGGLTLGFPATTAIEKGNHHLQKVVTVLIPSENDLPLNLLLCRDARKVAEEEEEEEAMKASGGSFGKGGSFQQPNLRIYASKDVKRSRLAITTNDVFCIRYGDIKEGQEKVTVKEFPSVDDVGHHLAEVSKWIHLQDSSIVNCRGLILNPFSVLFEFCDTSLADLLQSCNNADKKALPVGLLVQAGYCLAKALDYLYSQEFVHGAIRLEHIFVSAYKSEKMLRIKLGDPIGIHSKLRIGVFDTNRERPWLPPEFFHFQNSFPSTCSSSLHRLTSYGDVWAFGTTLWQIFNGGERPLDDPKVSLAISDHFRASDDSVKSILRSVEQLMRQCWVEDYTVRIQPCSILGRMSRLLSKVYSRNAYSVISNPNSKIQEPSSQQANLAQGGGLNSLEVNSAKNVRSSGSVANRNNPIRESQGLQRIYQFKSTQITGLNNERKHLVSQMSTVDGGQTFPKRFSLKALSDSAMNEENSIYSAQSSSTELPYYEPSLINNTQLTLLKTIGKVFVLFSFL